MNAREDERGGHGLASAWTQRYEAGEWDDQPGELAALYVVERVAALLRPDTEPFHPDRDRIEFKRYLIDIGCQPPRDAAPGRRSA